MLKTEIKSISEDYFKYLTDTSKFKLLDNDSIEFYTPILDHFGDSISVNIRKKDSNYIISDYGETLWNLEQFGVNLLEDKRSKKYQLLKDILDYNDISLEDADLNKYADKDNLSQSIHDYVQAIANVSNLAIVKREMIKSLFKEEVIQYFLTNRDIYPNFFPDLKVEGKSKLSHSFDGVFPGENPKFIKTLKHVSLSNAKNLMFDWEDVEEYRNKNYDSNAQLNIITESKDNISKEAQTMLAQYKVDIISFDNKAMVIDKFSIR
ncbi:DUF1828 domain-containing protein [Staphylococcus hominis]|nr:DUF1828 domain-containing protein [Staphylococcus hominis]